MVSTFKAVVATWNTRGANTTKLQVITNEMTRVNIKIVGIAEHWMLGKGYSPCKKETSWYMQERSVGPEEKA